MSSNFTSNIVGVAVDIPLPFLPSYTCHSHPNAKLGSRVLVSVGQKTCVGFIIEINQKPTELVDKLKELLQVFNEIISQDIIDLLKFCSKYYHYPIGQTVFCAIPPVMRKGHEINYLRPTKTHKITSIHASDVSPNQSQINIVTQITQHLGKYHSAILYGVTGSGKTLVYLEVIKQVLNQNQQALVLVPEINLTPQLLSRFALYFPNQIIKVITSNNTPKERFENYLSAQNNQTNIIIGTRVAVFTPFTNLGVIIIDEEHDQSFKQTDSLHYHARDVAIFRAKQLNIPIIMGSATPSLESLLNYEHGKHVMYQLNDRAVSDATLPNIKLAHLVNDTDIFANISIDAINKCLTNHELSLIFINRRGYAPIFTCGNCNFISTCNNCDIRLVYHADDHKLKCHHCLNVYDVPNNCPKCNSENLYTIGHGTQKITEILLEKFPDARIHRIDQDSLNHKTSFGILCNKIHNNEIDIIVGTQILAKGHDFANLTLVVALNSDQNLFSHDFRATENLYAQLTQVAGRAGRHIKSGEVIIQTKYPSHPLYQYLIKHDFHGFSKYLLALRKDLNLPPFGYFALLNANSTSDIRLINYLTKIYKKFKDCLGSSQLVTVHAPVKSTIARLKNQQRGYILISSNVRTVLHRALDILDQILAKNPSYKVSHRLDVDPFELY